MAKNRDTYKYHFKIGNRIVHGGVTKNLDRREREHQQDHPSGHIKQVGRRTTEEAARTWEEDNSYRPEYPAPQIPPDTGSVRRTKLRRALREAKTHL